MASDTIRLKHHSHSNFGLRKMRQETSFTKLTHYLICSCINGIVHIFFSNTVTIRCEQDQV